MINIDIIGVLYSTAIFETDGKTVVTPSAELPGWHVNATAPVANWAQWRASPSTPHRVFSGGETVFYAFSSQSEFSLALQSVDLQSLPVSRYSPKIPEEVEMRQAKHALLRDGVLDIVDLAIRSMPGMEGREAFIEWTSSTKVHRRHPLVNAMQLILQKTDMQMDELFLLASGL